MEAGIWVLAFDLKSRESRNWRRFLGSIMGRFGITAHFNLRSQVIESRISAYKSIQGSFWSPVALGFQRSHMVQRMKISVRKGT